LVVAVAASEDEALSDSTTEALGISLVNGIVSNFIGGVIKLS
jgi:hypothetical protein